MENLQDLQILEIKENINVNIKSSIVKAQEKRQENLKIMNSQKDEEIKLLIDKIINNDLIKLEQKKIKLYKKLSKIL
jgi:transcription-repair coupling factor (superfamily II helicase)